MNMSCFHDNNIICFKIDQVPVFKCFVFSFYRKGRGWRNEDELGQSLWCQNHLFLRFLLLNKVNRTALKLRLSSIFIFLRSSSILVRASLCRRCTAAGKRSDLCFWSERSACAALGCWHKRRWPLQMAFFSLSSFFFLLSFSPAHC